MSKETELKYGIFNEHFEGDELPTKVIAFGDGKNRINTLLWDDRVGISLFRDETQEAFSYRDFKAEGVKAPKMPDEKVFITFDNIKSIDAMFNQLGYIYEHLSSGEGVSLKQKCDTLTQQRDKAVELLESIREYASHIPLHFSSGISNHGREHIQHFVDQIVANSDRAISDLKETNNVG